MARNSRTQGLSASVVVVMLVIAWVMGRCSGGSSNDALKAPTVYSQPQAISQPASLAPAEPLRPVAPVERRYVDAASLNVRESPNGAVVGKLAGGQEVLVQESRAGWLRVEGGGTSGWIAARYTCASAGCWRPAPVQAPAPVARASRQSYTGGCPCSGSANCYGPRGGRYCITSGGNKRYR